MYSGTWTQAGHVMRFGEYIFHPHPFFFFYPIFFDEEKKFFLCGGCHRILLSQLEIKSDVNQLKEPQMAIVCDICNSEFITVKKKKASSMVFLFSCADKIFTVCEKCLRRDAANESQKTEANIA